MVRKLLFVNVGPAGVSESGEIYTGVRNWVFINDMDVEFDLHYMGPVDLVPTSKNRPLWNSYLVNASVVKLPFFFRISGLLKNMINPLFIYKFGKALTQCNWDYDVILLRDMHPLSLMVWIIAKIKRIPVVLQISSNPRKIAQASFKGGKRLFYVSYAFLRESVEYLISKSTLVILSCDHPYIKPTSSLVFKTHFNLISTQDYVSKEFVNDKYGKIQTPTILFVGRMSPEKGVENLVKAVKVLVDNGLDLSLELVGDGPDFVRISELVKDLNLAENVELCGNVSNREDLLEYYKNASIFVLPSIEDATPKVLLEAMAVGLPIISTDVGEISNVLNGVGKIVKSGNIISLAEAIEELLIDQTKMKELGLSGLNHALTESREIKVKELCKRVSNYVDSKVG